MNVIHCRNCIIDLPSNYAFLIDIHLQQRTFSNQRAGTMWIGGYMNTMLEYSHHRLYNCMKRWVTLGSRYITTYCTLHNTRRTHKEGRVYTNESDREGVEQLTFRQTTPSIKSVCSTGLSITLIPQWHVQHITHSVLTIMNRTCT